MRAKSNRLSFLTVASFCIANAFFAPELLAAGCPDWVEVTTERFRLYGSLKTTKALEIAESLNRFEAAIEIVTNSGVRKSDVPTNLVVLEYSDWFRFMGSQLRGVFQDRPFENILLIPQPGDRGTNPYTYAMHEYVHFILHSQAGFSYPKWYHEGLAEVLSASQEEADIFQLGFLWRERLHDAKNSLTWAPLKDVLNKNGPAIDFRNPAHTTRFYGQATLLAHYLLFSPTRNVQLVAYLKALNNSVPADKAFEDSFGTTYEQLDTEVKAYARQKDFPVFRLPKSMLAQKEKPTVRTVSCSDGQLTAGMALLQLGADPADVASRFFKNTDDAPSAILRLARADVALRNKEVAKANTYIEEALKAPALTGSEMLTAAELLVSEIRHPEKSEDKLSDRDRALLERVQSVLADQRVRELKSARMAYAVANVALLLGTQLDDALEVAFQAVERAPHNSYLAEVTALLCHQKGDVENAAGAWSIVAAYAREASRRRRAKDELAAIDASLPHRK